MADCSELEARLAAAEERLAQAKKLQRTVEGEAELDAKAGPGSGFRTFSMVDGTKIRINAKEFYDQVEADNIAMGEEQLRQLVRERFDKKVKPKGSQGMNINYAQMPFNDENVNALLELAGARRANSAAGQELAQKFTEEVARDQLLQEVALQGGNVEEIARGLSRDTGAVAKLPLRMVLITKMRSDSARYYADMLDDAADLISSFGLSPQKKAELSRASQYMHFFEQLDALYARKIGQALRARSFDQFKEVQFGVDSLSFEDVSKLNMDTLKEGSLAAQVLEAIESGDAESLRRVATAKRVLGAAEATIDEPNFFTQIRLLNDLRKDNFFLSPSTWIQRNVVAGAGVNFYMGVEDFASAAFKTGSLKEAYEMSTFAANRMFMGMNEAFSAAFQVLNSGKPTLTSLGMKENVDPRSLQNAKQYNAEQIKFVKESLNEAWSTNFLGAAGASPFAAMNLMNLGIRNWLGTAIEKMTGSTAGYMPAFHLLASGDEITRHMAKDWASSSTAWLQALDEWKGMANKPNVPKPDWVAQRANELAEQAVFSGAMTDDELVKLRRQAGAQQYGDMSNEALRLKIMNDQAGVPRPDTPAGRAALGRMQEVTFTKPVDAAPETLLDFAVSGIGPGINRARQNPLVGWNLPVFTTPWNGLKWLLNRDLFVSTADLLLKEAHQAQARFRDADLPYTADEMADARSRTVVAAGMALIVNQLWQRGIFTDGGSFVPDQNKRERDRTPPYSFSIGTLGLMGMSKINIPGSSIDIVDLMGLQADVQRAFYEGVILDPDYNKFMNAIVKSYARIIGNKESLSGVVDLFNGMTSSAQNQNTDWVNLVSRQFNGILPLSGAMTWGSRAGQDPALVQGRREMSDVEVQALGKDPNYNLFQQFASKIARNYPILGAPGYQARNRDWLGRDIKRPFSIPYDTNAPFAPILTSDTPLDRWMEKHGFGAPPHPSGKIGASQTRKGYGGATMSIEEENTWHREFTTMKGELPASGVLGKNAVISTGFGVYNIDRYVQGNTVLEALTALSQDPDYNLDLDTPFSPSLARTKGEQRPYSEQSLSERTKLINDPRGIYKVWDAVVTYYDLQAIDRMGDQHPDFVAKALANAEVKDLRIQEDFEAVLPSLSSP